MNKKHGVIGLSKTTHRHSTYTNFAAEGVSFLNRLASVEKIVPSIISAQSGRRSGHRSIRANRVNHAGLEIKFSGGGIQTIYIIVTDREQVIGALRDWAAEKGNCVFRVAGL